MTQSLLVRTTNRNFDLKYALTHTSCFILYGAHLVEELYLRKCNAGKAKPCHCVATVENYTLYSSLRSWFKMMTDRKRVSRAFYAEWIT